MARAAEELLVSIKGQIEDLNEAMRLTDSKLRTMEDECRGLRDENEYLKSLIKRKEEE